MPHRSWLRRTTGETSAHGIARKVGRSHTTVLRWLKSGVPADAVVELCIRFELDIIEALIATGYMTAADVPQVRVDRALREAPVWLLTRELDRRAEHLRENGALVTPDASAMR
jgi:hypothetical protein